MRFPLIPPVHRNNSNLGLKTSVSYIRFKNALHPYFSSLNRVTDDNFVLGSLFIRQPTVVGQILQPGGVQDMDLLATDADQS